MTAMVDTSKLLICSEKLSPEENLSTRLTFAMRKLGVNQSDLARRIGIKPQAIQYLCTSNAERSRFAFDIADSLGINLDWLIAGKGRMINDTVQRSTAVPIINWSDIKDWVAYQDSGIESVGTTNSQVNCSTESYALKVMDSSMSPRFEINTTLIIDPKVSARENDYVIVDTNYSANPILRQLVTKKNKQFLYPVNTALYKEIEFSEHNAIFGVLRQTLYEFVRG